jgi:transposase
VAHASPTAIVAMARIGALYAIEEEIRASQSSSVALYARLALGHCWIIFATGWRERFVSSPPSQTAAAIRYALSHWRALTRYVDDGLLEIDNNAADRSLRAVVMGRKNYLFMGSSALSFRCLRLSPLFSLK